MCEEGVGKARTLCGGVWPNDATPQNSLAFPNPRKKIHRTRSPEKRDRLSVSELFHQFTALVTTTRRQFLETKFADSESCESLCPVNCVRFVIYKFPVGPKIPLHPLFSTVFSPPLPFILC
jgi:hypothetical protein